MMNKVLEQGFICEQEGLSISDFLKQETNLSKTKLKDTLKKGGVWLLRLPEEPTRIRQHNYQVKHGDEIHIYYDPEYLALPQPKLEQLHQEQDWSVWNKPEGINDNLNLFSDHLSLESIIDNSLANDINCYSVLPNLPFSTGKIILTHSSRAAALLEEKFHNSEISFEVSTPSSEGLIKLSNEEELNDLRQELISLNDIETDSELSPTIAEIKRIRIGENEY